MCKTIKDKDMSNVIFGGGSNGLSVSLNNGKNGITVLRPSVSFTGTASNLSLKNTNGSTGRITFNGATDTIILENQVAGNRLDNLVDVDTTVSQANGSILVYDQDTDKYVQRPILQFDAKENVFRFEGGTF